MAATEKARLVPGVTASARAELPSRFGDFDVVGFTTTNGDEFAAVVKGDVDGKSGVPVRLHSECFTGDVMGSLKCDCRDQLEAALNFLGRSERGVVVYLRQEGRGIGLVNKVRAYALQDQGMDTVQANEALGFEDDLRRYDEAAEAVKALGIESVVLMTNNPKKIEGLRRAGVAVVGTLPVRTPPNRHNAFYLETKKEKSGHLL
jgi:GTP cyclohydrolase II